MRLRYRSFALSCLLFACPVAVASAADDEALFREAASIFERRCVSCHEGSAAKGALSLTTAQSALRGGDGGAAIVPGKPDESFLLDYVSGDDPEMPKDAAPLSAEEVAVLRRWIEAGAPWSAGIELADKKENSTDWWSLRMLARPEVPAATEWARTPIDNFIAAKLAEHGLTPSPEADRRTLIRRLYFDLIGLPPSPEEVDAFVGSTAPNAYEALVDRLLASPQYGERWGRHWLDVAHYADTHGYDKDKIRPHAWPYRDYVIRSLNEDKPYSRFVLEQLAGDVLFPETAEGIIATGFIAAGPFDYVGQIEVRDGTLDKAITRNLDRDDMVASTMNTFNSMTVQCARCHNHKFDPITQEDYYSLQAIFAGVDRANRSYTIGESSGVVFAAATDFPAEGAFTPTAGKPRPIHLLQRGSEAQPREEVGPGTASYLPELGSRFELPADASEGDRRAALARWLVDPRNPLTWRSIVNRVWHYHFGAGIVDSPNDFGRMGAKPSHPELLDWLAVEFRDGGSSIPTPQSLKALHRLICKSAVYRQTSASHEQGEAADSGNQLLWRMNRRKLEAEAVWDSVLLMSGKLNPAQGGPGFFAFGFEDDHSPRYKYVEYNPDDPASHLRSIYRFIVRSAPDPFMTTLDCADSSTNVAKRNETLTPLQSLALLNNKFMVRMADHFAQRVQAAAPDLPAQITTAWRLAFGREPAPDELSIMKTYADEHGLANTCRLIFNMNEFVFVD